MANEERKIAGLREPMVYRAFSRKPTISIVG